MTAVWLKRPPVDFIAAYNANNDNSFEITYDDEPLEIKFHVSEA